MLHRKTTPFMFEPRHHHHPKSVFCISLSLYSITTAQQPPLCGYIFSTAGVVPEHTPQSLTSPLYPSLSLSSLFLSSPSLSTFLPFLLLSFTFSLFYLPLFITLSFSSLSLFLISSLSSFPSLFSPSLLNLPLSLSLSFPLFIYLYIS